MDRIIYHNEFLSYIIIYFRSKVKRMSRGNVFKLSGNMALGGNSDYHNADIEDIKNSLKLLKSKQNQKRSNEPDSLAYGYSGSKNQGYKNNYDFDSLSKNHMPSQKEVPSRDYGKNYSNDIGSKYKNYGGNDYDQYGKPPSYPQQSYNKPAKNVRTEKYDEYDYEYSNKKGSSYTPSTLNYSKQSQRKRQPNYPQKSYKEGYSQKDEKSIKEVNRENQVQIRQYDPSQFKECRMGCGRMFNPESIAKHEKNCKKVFQKKRKQFDSQKHRIVATEQKQLMRKGEMVEKKIEAKKKVEKIPKWKADSMKFRAVLKENRKQDLDPREKAMIQQATDQSTVKCHICGRKFNEEAGKRHIKFCEEQAKKNAMKRKK